MATTHAAPPPPIESTFRNYSTTQAQAYAESRLGYSKSLIDHIISSHTSTGGQLNHVLDLGCGPGNATRDLALHFTHASGLDPSTSMIATAKELGGKTQAGESISYAVGEAEVCQEVADGGVDLITAATCAHWFDMGRFWPTAERILKPGGTVAIFVIVRGGIHPDTKHREEVEGIIHELGHVTLEEFKMPGNEVARGNYRDLVLPWDLNPPVQGFKKEEFVRRTWNEDGKPEADVEGGYFAGVYRVSVKEVEKRYGTSSAVTRWREVNLEIAGTEKDVIRIAFRKMEELFEREGEEPIIHFVGATTLLLFKKS